MKGVLLFLSIGFIAVASAKEIETNEILMLNAPEWLTRNHVEKVTEHIQTHLEWTTRKVTVTWYKSEGEYDRAQSYGAMTTAVTKYSGGVASIHIGPQVNAQNFDQVFGHELVHVIIYQKYKDAVPKWLEEGLANYLSSGQKVDYQWLAKQPFPDDVHKLAHPFSGAVSQVNYRYKASQAFAEMLAKKCDLEELLRLSVAQKMEDYMKTYCEINDLNASFREWVKKKAGRS